MKIILDFIIVLSLLFTGEVTSDLPDPTEVNDYDEIFKYTDTKVGETMPMGWIKEQMRRDLTEGYLGHFDHVDHTVTHELFVHQDRRSNKRYKYDRSWWSGEHEGYWKDGVLRMAYLTKNEEYMERASKWIYDIMDHTGEEGYIGIYEKCDASDCRFHHNKENGELWATSRILMPMLAFYEITGDEKVLQAVEKCTRLFIDKYTERNYFVNKANKGGVSHGIGFFENLEWLYRITKDTLYSHYAIKLYEDFNTGVVRDDDLKTEPLLNEKRYFRKHGAHIAEGFFVPGYIAALVDDPTYKSAANNALKKLDYHITPGGAMRADEFINGREGSADEKYEYCGITEIINPLRMVFTYTDNFSIGDRIEDMTYNAGQGARFPVLKAVSYVTPDNRIHIKHGGLLGRERYDANHKAAACCVLNAGRLMPYFVEGMWQKTLDNKGLVAFLYGPNKLNTSINNTEVEIIENTTYPFSDQITFEVHPKEPVNFQLILRIPHNSQLATFNGIDDDHITKLTDRIIIEKTWTNSEEFTVDFNFTIQKVVQEASSTVKGGGYYLKRGPLVYALPFDYEQSIMKEYNNSGHYRYKLVVDDKTGWKYKIDEDIDFEFTTLTSEENLIHPWDEPAVALNGKLLDKEEQPKEVTLVPMGNTVFRRVTFESVD